MNNLKSIAKSVGAVTTSDPAKNNTRQERSKISAASNNVNKRLSLGQSKLPLPVVPSQDRRRTNVQDDRYDTNSQASSNKGTCPVCKIANICLIAKSGTLRKHGHSGNNSACPGSYGPPKHFVPASDVDSQRDPEQRPFQHNVDDDHSAVSVQEDFNNFIIRLSSGSSSSPILKWIPKGARVAASTLLSKLIQAILDAPDDIKGWKRFLGFASACFAKPSRGGKSRNLTKSVLRQIASYSTETVLVHEQQEVTESNRKERNSGAFNHPVDVDSAIAKRAAAKLEEGNVKGAIRLLCSNNTIASPNLDSFTKLSALHPPVPEDRRVVASTDCIPLSASCDDIRKAVQSFPNGSAGSFDGLRPQHLKDLLGIKSTDNNLIENITSLINLILAGKVPELVRPTLFGGALTALNKKDGGLRPIVVGNTWRRLAAKVACRHVYERCAEFLAPRQLGFGVSGGAEAAAHAARRYIQSMDSNKVFMKIDFSNAFNTLRRDVILCAIKTNFPELFNFAVSTYEEITNLRFGDYSISSQEGTQQGDPLGPLYFCMSIQPILSKLACEFVTGYLDDISLGGDVDIAIDDFIFLESEAGKLGLKLNRSKCEVIGASENSKTKLRNNGIILSELDPSEAVLLGSPLHEESMDKTIEIKCKELELISNRLKLMPAHDGLFLLKNALAIPKLMYILRTAPCFKSDKLNMYDVILRRALESILNVELKENCWIQATLPVKFGGLGLRSAVQLAPSAYLALAASTTDLANRLLPSHCRDTADPYLSDALICWRLQVDPETQIPLDDSKQRNWDSLCQINSADNLLQSSMDSADRARLLAARSDGSGDWINALPLSSVGLKLDNISLRIAVALRIGAFVVYEHKCICGATVSSNGHHGLSCRMSAGRQSRHASVNDIIQRALHSAGVASIREPTGLCQDDKRPDGITLIPWAKGRCVVWDFTCPDTLAPSHVNTTSRIAGSAADAAEANKLVKYSDMQNCYDVTPVAIETLGSWGQRGMQFINEIGRKIAEATDEPRSTIFLRQRIMIAIQRGNASAVLGTHKHLMSGLDKDDGVGCYC